jgi:drug/metabolite transporter (DMT)-like permease
MNEKIKGHVLALLTVTIWGITYIATKIMLESYDELQILALRFIIAYILLWIVRPKLMKAGSLKDEVGIFTLSFFGVVVYYLLENMALTYSPATNVSILVSFAPIVTAVGMHLTSKADRINRFGIIGFLVAISGVILVVYNGTVMLKLSPAGDILSLGATVAWAVYSILIGRFLDKYDSVMLTRRMFLYSLILIIPATLIKSGIPDLSRCHSLDAGLSLLLLGVFGSCLCYLWWNQSIKTIGVVTTTNYVYLIPFVTMVSAFFILKEDITIMGLAGATLIIAGVAIADKKTCKKEPDKKQDAV